MGDDGAVIGWIREIVLNAGDPCRLASFWAGLLGRTPVEWYSGWVTLELPPHGRRLSFREPEMAMGPRPTRISTFWLAILMLVTGGQ